MEDHIDRLRGGAHISGVEIAIVGAGPAGISAAVQLKKEGLAFTLFEKGRPGGLLWYANRVDNLLAHRGRSGKELCRLFDDHLREMGIVIEYTEVRSIEMAGARFMVNGRDFSHVILATGSSPREVDIPGVLYFIEDEKELNGKRLLILGGGDLAYDNALRAANAGGYVTIARRGEPRANSMLLEEARSAGIREIIADEGGIIFHGDHYQFGDDMYDLLAVFIGRSPNRGLISRMGPVEIDIPSFSTSVNGLYVVGDAALGTVSQTALSSGSGLAAAMHISQMVKER
ncbi:MAG: NAD(P)/FAD-dependent oxidoreductase [Thermoplasmatota archaeon]